MSHALREVPEVTYSPSDHTIIIPRSLLTDPMFRHNYPRYEFYHLHEMILFIFFYFII